MKDTLFGLLWGIVSAIALPLGCLVALWKDPGEKACAFLMAFGGGSLLFALTLELFAEAIINSVNTAEILAVMCPSAVAGGLIFIAVNHFINNWGSFLRKISTKTHFLSTFPTAVREQLKKVALFRQTQSSESQRIIDSQTPLVTVSIENSSSQSPEHTVVGGSSKKRLHEVGGSFSLRQESVEMRTLLRAKARSTHQVGMAIWVGILIDGIPESIIIGILAASESGISVAFIMGVFLSNFPEALSSSLEMRRQGMPKRQVFLMWSSLCVITGLGSMLSAAIFPRSPNKTFVLLNMGFEGVAAGAMLTMIAQTMLPEAYAQGGELSGLATLLGFLAALTVKLSDDIIHGE